MSNVITDEQAKEYIGDNVARLRGTRSRSWLARTVGTFPINITRIERGTHLPQAGLLCRLAEALDTSMEELISPPPGKSKKTG
jgi:transcriptional regulator with XRE-family HTH domain